MKIYGSNYRKLLEQEIIDKYIEPAVISVRESLAKNHDIYYGMHKDYAGLCDRAASMFIDNMFHTDINDISELKVTAIHGEQSHHPRLESKNWCHQHTWVVVECIGMKIYVDPTSQQFQKFYDDIPNYYISSIKPKWFYPDDDNKAWRGLGNKINESIQIKRKMNDKHGKPTIIHDGIIEFVQYEIWGKVSDILRKIKKWK